MPTKDFRKTTEISDIARAIFESEQEIANGTEAIDADIVFGRIGEKTL